eukprot:2018537-Rhodomonas_salina.1
MLCPSWAWLVRSFALARAFASSVASRGRTQKPQSEVFSNGLTDVQTSGTTFDTINSFHTKFRQYLNHHRRAIRSPA